MLPLQNVNSSEDNLLFRRIAVGDEQAFELIFHKYTPRLHSFVFRIVKVSAIADEIVQEVFLKLWLNRENLVHVNDPAKWLFKLTFNQALNQLRKQANEYKHLKRLIHAEGIESIEILEGLSVKELQLLIYEAVENLPGKRKQVYLLSREEEFSYKEIAGMLKISTHTVKNQLVLALKSIQEYLVTKRSIYIPFILLGLKINCSTISP